MNDENNYLDEFEGGEENGEVGFQIDAIRRPRRMTRVTVRQSGALRHEDEFNLSRAADRLKFCKRVAGKLGVAEDAVEEQLLVAIQQLEEQDGEDEGDEEAAGSDALVLVGLAEEAELFHTADGKAYAAVPVNGHRETYPIRGMGFKHWLVIAFRHERGRPPGTDALSQALLTLEAQALLDGPTREVFLRVAAVEGDEAGDPTIYVDLCDPDRRAVRVTAQGWTVIAQAPVLFRRPRGQHPLPVPLGGGTLAELRQFLNLPGDRGWRRFLPWLVKGFYPPGPAPILAISGEQGSAKSSLGRVARLLIDPHEVVDRGIPRDIRDLMIAASNSAVLSFDNVSHLPDWFADAVCRLATGASFATRELFTDEGEAQFTAKRPVILNGIPDLTGQGDVLDRAILEHLPKIPKAKRKTERVFWSEFHERRPAILGAVLDCLVGALQILPTLPESNLPRMADFALFGEAVCRAAGEPAGSFEKSYRANIREAAGIVLDNSVVAVAIQELMTAGSQAWEGQAQDLMNLLPTLAAPDGASAARLRGWPQSPRGMSGALRRLAPALRAFGIGVEFHKGADHAGKRLITIRRIDHAG